MVCGFHGVLLQSAKQDLLSDGKTLYEKPIRRTIQRTNNSVWLDGRISPYFCQRPVATASVRQESLAGYIPWLCTVRVVNLERGHCGRRH